MISILNDEFATILVYPEKSIIHHTFHQPVKGENFRRVLQTAADAYIKHKCKKWLSDDRNNGVIHFSDMEWAEKLWLEFVVPSGWRYWAVLPSNKIKVQVNFQEIISAFRDRGVIIELFHDVEKAMNWLDSKQV